MSNSSFFHLIEIVNSNSSNATNVENNFRGRMSSIAQLKRLHCMLF